MADYDNIEHMPINELRQEEGAHELGISPNMKPYLQFVMAVMQDQDPTPELEAIRQLPLEKRYVWRVAAALKWALADCETLNVKADKETLSSDDLAKVVDLLQLRPVQICLFLRELVGAEEMQRLMLQAIDVARQT